jgi:hypothetical protein
MEVSFALNRAFGVELPLTAIFRAPTVRRLTAELESAILDQLEAMTDEEAAANLSNQDA